MASSIGKFLTVIVLVLGLATCAVSLLHSKENLKRASLQGSCGDFPADFSLLSLDGSNGFTMQGLQGDKLADVITTGDLNGDGALDVILGNSNAYANPFRPGAFYAIFGGKSSYPSVMNLSTAYYLSNVSNGVTLFGLQDGDKFGISVDNLGDINDDGKSDFIIGSPFVDRSGISFGANAGAAYIIPGSSNYWGNTSTIGSDHAITTVIGISGSDDMGCSVASLGDFNDDGFTDFVVGARFDNQVLTNAGAVFVIFGRAAAAWPSSVNVSLLNGTDGFQIRGNLSSGELGFRVSSAGDLNGDSIPDLMIAQKLTSNNRGAVYIIFGSSGPWNATFNLSTLDGSNGFSITGRATSDFFGSAMDSVGDVNGDGLDDVLFGAYGVDPSPSLNSAGAAYVLFGKQTWLPAFNLSTLDGSNGFLINGIASIDSLGISVATAGDINADGYSDILLGANAATYNSNAQAGRAYVVFGSNSFPASLNLSALNGSNGFLMGGIDANIHLGNAVGSVGDINGDGIDDFGVSAPDARRFFDIFRVGHVYVVFGRAKCIQPSTAIPSVPLLPSPYFSPTVVPVGVQPSVMPSMEPSLSPSLDVPTSDAVQPSTEPSISPTSGESPSSTPTSPGTPSLAPSPTTSTANSPSASTPSDSVPSLSLTPLSPLEEPSVAPAILVPPPSTTPTATITSDSSTPQTASSNDATPTVVTSDTSYASPSSSPLAPMPVPSDVTSEPSASTLTPSSLAPVSQPPPSSTPIAKSPSSPSSVGIAPSSPITKSPSFTVSPSTKAPSPVPPLVPVNSGVLVGPSICISALAIISILHY